MDMKLNPYRNVALFVVSLAVTSVFVSVANANEASLVEAFNAAHSFLSVSRRASMPAQAAKPASQVVGTVSTSKETIPERIKKLKAYVEKNGAPSPIAARIAFALKFTKVPEELATRQANGDNGTSTEKATERYFFSTIIKTPSTEKYADNIILIKQDLISGDVHSYRVNADLKCVWGTTAAYGKDLVVIPGADCQAPVASMLSDWADAAPALLAPATADKPLSNNPKSLTASQNLK